jgi:processive 1,2-diacylglycerol beta-glucosyltransferase
MEGQRDFLLSSGRVVGQGVRAMTGSPRTRILVLTAGFGEGHNSAAQHLAVALRTAGVEVQVADPCLLGAPVATRFVQGGYRWMTALTPWLWGRMFKSADGMDFTRRSWWMKYPEAATRRLVAEFRPHAVVSTYPLYPYFLDRLAGECGTRLPTFLVVTDSLVIHGVWRKAVTDFWLVTDGRTRQALIDAGLAPERVVETGFPVHPRFADLSPLGPEDPLAPFKILYFPTPNRPHVRRTARALLDAVPEQRAVITIVLGRRFRRLFPYARQIKAAYPGRVRLTGWTRRVPELLTSHHLVVGKAGGATVHEALAARCPMIVDHLVPGQEEGNLALLRAINGGILANTPERITAATREVLADHANRWREMKRSLATHARPSAATTAADFIINHLRGGAVAAAEPSAHSGSA